MPRAGQRIMAGRVPGQRIATSAETTDSDDVTDSETEVQSVTATLVSGLVYRVVWDTSISGTVDGDSVGVRIREDTATGDFVQNRRTWVTDSSSGFGDYVRVEGEYMAVASGDKTFVASAVRLAGSGDISRHGSSSSPSYMYVEYIRG